MDVHLPKESLSDLAKFAFELFDVEDNGFVWLHDLSADMLSAVKFAPRGIWTTDDIEALSLIPDGETLLKILHELDEFSTGVVTQKSFKAGIHELAGRQLVVDNGVIEMIGLEQRRTDLLRVLSSQIDGVKSDFKSLHESQILQAQSMVHRYEREYAASGSEEVGGLSAEEFERRLTLRMVGEKARTHLRKLETEGEAELKSRLEDLKVAQTSMFEKFEAELSADKSIFVERVQAGREEIWSANRTLDAKNAEMNLRESQRKDYDARQVALMAAEEERETRNVRKLVTQRVSQTVMQADWSELTRAIPGSSLIAT